MDNVLIKTDVTQNNLPLLLSKNSVKKVNLMILFSIGTIIIS